MREKTFKKKTFFKRWMDQIKNILDKIIEKVMRATKKQPKNTYLFFGNVFYIPKLTAHAGQKR